MPAKESRRLRIGVLGAGQIAQAAHFESCTKARNADLAAICDVADDLRERMAVVHGVGKTFADYDRMLADPEIDAVIIATAPTRSMSRVRTGSGGSSSRRQAGAQF